MRFILFLEVGLYCYKFSFWNWFSVFHRFCDVVFIFIFICREIFSDFFFGFKVDLSFYYHAFCGWYILSYIVVRKDAWNNFYHNFLILVCDFAGNLILNALDVHLKIMCIMRGIFVWYLVRYQFSITCWITVTLFSKSGHLLLAAYDDFSCNVSV